MSGCSLWNPYQGYGVPLAANQQSQPFYPLTVALLLHITPRTYNWFLLSRLLLAGIGSYFYLRFFVSFWAGITGGVTSMLAGYYVLFITMPQLSVEILLPTSLLAAEYLLRKRNYRSIVAFAIVLLLVFLGGMPESALLLFTLLYSLYIVPDCVRRESARVLAATIARLMAAGLRRGWSLAAFFLLPFWEFMHRSFDLHQPHNIGGGISRAVCGLHLVYRSSLISFRCCLGPPYTGVFGLRNYVGLIEAFLLVIAVAAVFSQETRERPDRSGRLPGSSFALRFCLFLKRYGVPGINDIGKLPLFQMVNFVKYRGSASLDMRLDTWGDRHGAAAAA